MALGDPPFFAMNTGDTVIHFCQRRPRRRRLLLLLLLGAVGLSAAAGFEETIQLRAGDLLPPDLLRGEHYEVQDKVLSDGFLNTYDLHSDFGNWQVRSTALLRIRIKEVGAIASLKALEQSEEFQSAVGKDVNELADGFKRLGEDPEGALQGAASGVKKMFKLGGEAWRSRHTRDEEESVAASLGKSVSGFDKKKREYAAEFGVDPYSSNPKLQAELDRIAAAATSGGLLVTAAKAVTPGGIGSLVSLTGMSTALNDLLIETSPVELRIINREKLLALGADADLVELFLDNTVFTPTYQTYMTGGLEKLKGVDGINNFLKHAISTDDGDLAFFRTRVVLMYAWYHNEREKLARFMGMGRTVVAVSASNRAIFMAALDHVGWTETLADGADEFDETIDRKGFAGKEFWITGTTSKKAEAELERRGWEIKQHTAG